MALRIRFEPPLPSAKHGRSPATTIVGDIIVLIQLPGAS
jgi:hypothetical protein